MKKTIMLSLIVSSLVMGANTVDNLVINQQNKITSDSTIDNATVDQGKTEILGASDVDDVTIIQNGTNNGNLIENSDIVGSYTNNLSVVQGKVKIKNSSATNLTLRSENRIKNVELLNSVIEQGSFTITDSNATDSDTNEVDIESINIVERTSVDSGVDINATEIKQDVTLLSTGAITDNLKVNYLNKITDSSVESTKVHQGILKVDNSNVDALIVSDSDGAANKNTINAATIEGGSVLQSSIYVYNQASVQNFKAKSTNLIDNSTSTDSTVSQSETTIN